MTMETKHLRHPVSNCSGSAGSALAGCNNPVLGCLLELFTEQLEEFMKPDPSQHAVTYRNGRERSQPLMRKTD